MRDADLSALAAPEVYPGAPTSVECHDTHGSWVFVAGEHALKVKRPVVLPFMDYGTLERRRAMCREEVRLNRRLAPGLYAGTVGILRREDGGVSLQSDDEAPGVIEVGVLMRRYDEGDTLAARRSAGTATAAELRRVGARIAAFHASEPRADQANAALAALRQAVRTTVDDLEAQTRETREIAGLRVLRARLEAALSMRRDDLLARGQRGLVVDGHGDLRAEHVLLTDPLQIVDAVEFDPGLRIADVACDLGFLIMDLEGLGASELAHALMDGYRDAGGDPGDDALLGLMGCYRALVRAKIDLVRGDLDTRPRKVGAGDDAGLARPRAAAPGRVRSAGDRKIDARRRVVRAKWHGPRLVRRGAQGSPRAGQDAARPRIGIHPSDEPADLPCAR